MGACRHPYQIATRENQGPVCGVCNPAFPAGGGAPAQEEPPPTVTANGYAAPLPIVLPFVLIKD